MVVHTMFLTIGYFPILSVVLESLLVFVSAHICSSQQRGFHGKHLVLLSFLEKNLWEKLYLFLCCLGATISSFWQ